jgi:hypothetical protein
MKTTSKINQKWFNLNSQMQGKLFLSTTPPFCLVFRLICTQILRWFIYMNGIGTYKLFLSYFSLLSSFGKKILISNLYFYSFLNSNLDCNFIPEARKYYIIAWEIFFLKIPLHLDTLLLLKSGKIWLGKLKKSIFTHFDVLIFWPSSRNLTLGWQNISGSSCYASIKWK